MKRVIVAGPADLQEAALYKLQAAAVVDPVPLGQVEEPPPELVSQRMLAQRVIAALEARRGQLKKEAPELVVAGGQARAEGIVSQVEKLLSRRNELESRLALLVKERDLLTPWGEFQPSELTALAEEGVHLRLYSGLATVVQELDLSAAAWQQRIPLDERGTRLGLAVLSLGEPIALDLDPVHLPERPLSAVRDEIAGAETELEQGRLTMGQLSAQLPALKEHLQRLQDRLRFSEVQAGLGGDVELFALSGWVPADESPQLEAALSELPVALLLEDPTDEDDVPIALKNPAFVQQFQPLLKAFNLPHYREWDPTLFIAPFMGIFFGFCLGDLGYGVILTAVAVWALMKFKPQGEIRLAVQWLAILGLCTVLVGGLTGNLFGLKLWELLGMESDQLLFTLNANPKVFFYASLGMGVVQLTVGMLIKLMGLIMRGQWQRVIGQLGWLSVFPALAVWAMMGTPWAFVGSVVVIFLFISPSPSVVHRLGGGAWALYNITGMVGNVMSYARIFGLGLSSGIIAMVVNTIAMTIAESIPVAGWPLAILVLLGGHTFNFVMAIIGSVVHPARLQFLEFFGEFFDGGGRAYEPFRALASPASRDLQGE